MNKEKFEEAIQNMFSNDHYNKTYLFYACMISYCKVTFEEMDSPAAVGWNGIEFSLTINPNLFNTYTLDDRIGILTHEMLHIINNHLTSRSSKDRNHKRWNYATDCAINQLIKPEQLPKSAILPNYFEKYGLKLEHNKPAEYYYDSIKDIEQKLPDVLEHKFNEDSNDETSDEFKQLSTKKMLENAKETVLKTPSCGIGSLPMPYNEWIELLSKQKEIKWQKYLYNVLGTLKAGTKKTIFKCNRRLPDRMELKGNKKDQKYNILWISDVSGSVKNSDFIEVSSELYNISKSINCDVDIIQVDSDVYELQKLKRNTKQIQRSGSGGTFLSIALNKVKINHYDAIIITTDGELYSEDIQNFINTKKHIIWIITKNGNCDDKIINNKKSKIFKLKGIL